MRALLAECRARSQAKKFGAALTTRDARARREHDEQQRTRDRVGREQKLERADATSEKPFTGCGRNGDDGCESRPTNTIRAPARSRKLIAEPLFH